MIRHQFSVTASEKVSRFLLCLRNTNQAFDMRETILSLLPYQCSLFSILFSLLFFNDSIFLFQFKFHLPPMQAWVVFEMQKCFTNLFVLERAKLIVTPRQPIAVSDVFIYICLIDIRDGSSKPVYGGVDLLQALSSAKTGRRSCFFMN